MEYQFREIEKKWQKFWAENKSFSASDDQSLPKYYVLDMFPYPSGAGLHVGHPLGYIASDIIARYKRLKGFNVLHPMGYDAFGLPAEQYAIQTGQHPALTTKKNIARYREQLDNLGLSFDWDREVRTSDPEFYQWTQWIFKQLFNAWYNPETNKAEPIDSLIEQFKKNGPPSQSGLKAHNWDALSDNIREEILMDYRLAYLSDTMVNWCPALGTVLANEEVKDGISERGGHPVEKKRMKQWSLRITAYAERLLGGLQQIDWTDSIKEAQRNWIGKSVGAEFSFAFEEPEIPPLKVFSTRPDTIFGCTFLVIAPEHPLVAQLTTSDREAEVKPYAQKAKNRSERERQAEVNKVSGVFTGRYAIHPFTGKTIPVWVSDYVLMGYGTGAIMAVPAHDARDYRFAKQFNIPIVEVVQGGLIEKEAYEAKEGTLIRSDFLNGLTVNEAIEKALSELEKKKAGIRMVNYRLRDAIFSRQRYWGEPFPVFYNAGVPKMVEDHELPVLLPDVDKYLPNEQGDPPLANAKNWTTRQGFLPDYNTMPGWAGSSWYFLRYMDPKNRDAFASKKAVDYWREVDLYIGGSEHATGHLLYFRFWTKFLFDLGLIPIDEPAKKLVNQGMILGRSLLMWQGFYQGTGSNSETLIRICSHNKIPGEIISGNTPYKNIGKIHYRVMIQFADDKDRLFRSRFNELKKQEIVFGDLDADTQVMWEIDDATGEAFIQLSPEIEKMSKSKFNVVNPDDIIEKFGADTLRMYEMFLGPLDQHKPWNTNGIVGVFNFLKKCWKLYHTENGFFLSEESPNPAELKILHKLNRKTEEDIRRFSFNTTVSAFMIAVNELTDLGCRKRAILEPLCIILSPFAPHIAEELWEKSGHKGGISHVSFPAWEEKYLNEDSFDYPLSVNGKTKSKLNLPLSLNASEIEKLVTESEEVARILQGNKPKKIIVVPGRIINIVA